MTTLQEVLDHSVERAGEYLRRSFRMPAHSLNAAQLTNYLEGKDVTVALATVTATGEPRVAPVGALFHAGRFAAPMLTTAARVKHVRRNPAVSLSLDEDNDFAVIVHGKARVVQDGDDFDALVARQREIGDGATVLSWGPREEVAFLVVDPDVMYTFARYPDRFPA